MQSFIALLLTSILWFARADDDFKGMYWSNSLKPPFGEINSITGQKVLSGWSHGGATQIKQNFVRLTPDKPSRVGWIFNTASAPKEDWTVLIRFRISGGSESMSGDGFGFWQTATNGFNSGMLMGSTDTFVGVGILFDSFANDELHRDVVVIASDGNEPVLMSGGKRFPGCESKFRRWEGREDFNIDQESIAKITMVGTKIIVEIDSLGNGEFTTCVEKDIGKFLPKDKSWKNVAHFSVSAATGALHDNHDILEIITTSAEHFDRLMELHDEVAEAPPVTISAQANITAGEVGQHVNTLAYEVKDIDERLQKLNHEIEHQVEKVSQRLEDLIDKLTAQERRLEERVSKLETRLSSDLYSQMDIRLRSLEESIYKNIEVRQEVISKQIGGNIKMATAEAQTWRTPLAIFAFVVLAVMSYLGYTVFRINKRVAKNDQRYFD